MKFNRDGGGIGGSYLHKRPRSEFLKESKAGKSSFGRGGAEDTLDIGE